MGQRVPATESTEPMSKASNVLSAPARLAALRRTALMDSPAEESFDRLARLASRVLDAPVALVALVDAERQFLKSCIGPGEPWSRSRVTPLSHSLCKHEVQTRRFGERMTELCGGRYRDRIRLVLVSDRAMLEQLDPADPVLLTRAAQQEIGNVNLRRLVPPSRLFSRSFARTIIETTIRLNIEAERR